MYYETFKNLYPVTKTVQFELVPDKRTKEIIEREGLLIEDEERNKNISVIKELITECHKHFINTTMAPNELLIDWQQLKDVQSAYQSDKTKDNLRKLSETQKLFRKEISNHIISQPGYKALRGSLLFDVTLKEIIDYEHADRQEELLQILESFEGYTSVFQDFFGMKDRIYGHEEKEGTIAYRIVHDNFPIWLSSLTIYEEMYEKYGEALEESYAEIKSHILFFAEYELQDIFTLEFYNNLLCAEGISAYKKLVNGIQISEDTIIIGLNNTASSFAQKNKEKRLKLPVLKKAIQTMDSSLNFSFSKIVDDNDCLNKLSNLITSIEGGNIYDRLYVFFDTSFRTYNAADIYIHKNMLSKISMVLYKKWDGIINILRKYIERQYPEKPNSKQKKEIENWLNREYVSLKDIQTAINSEDTKATFDIYRTKLLDSIIKAKGLAEKFHSEKENHLQTGMRLAENNSFKLYIKNLLESINYVAEEMKIFSVDGNIVDKGDFYISFDELYEEVCEYRGSYRTVRAYFKRKPYSTEKIKLNFGNQHLLNGWSSSVIKKNGGLMLKKGRYYYLAIANKEQKGNLEVLLNADPYDGPTYEAFVPDILASASRFVPKVIFTKAVKEFFEEQPGAEFYTFEDKKFLYPVTITNELWQLYNSKKYTLSYVKQSGDETGFKEALEKWILFHMEVLLKHSSSYKFDFSEIAKLDEEGSVTVLKEYENMPAFISEVDACLSRMSKFNIPEFLIDEMTERGEILLFRIRNNPLDYYAMYDNYKVKDLNTLYFMSLFTEQNLTNNMNKMCGNAAIRFRKKSLQSTPTHKKGEVLVSKIDKEGYPVPSEIYLELVKYLNSKAKKLSAEGEKYLTKVRTKIAKEDIIKDRRFSVDKFLFSLPIDLQAKTANTVPTITEFNANINQKLRENNVSVLAICRGQDSLLNTALVNPDGTVTFSKNLDVINGQDYKAKFKKRKADNLESEKSWNVSGTVRDLQEGYITAIVPLVIEMALKNNAVIAFADIRNQKKSKDNLLEDGAYELLMNSIQKKLCFYMRNHDIENVLQLCIPVEDKFVAVQNGIVFFISPGQIKEIDITTGFYNNLKLKDIMKNAQTKKDFLCTLDNLEYEESTDSFVFTIDYSKYDTYIPSNDIWEIHTSEKRYLSTKDEEIKTYTPTKDIKSALLKMGLDVSSRKLIQEISEIDADNSTSWFWSQLVQAYVSSVRMRTYLSNTKQTFISSPIRNATGELFESSLTADEMTAVALGMKTHVVLEKVKSGENKATRISSEEWLDSLKGRSTGAVK